MRSVLRLLIAVLTAAVLSLACAGRPVVSAPAVNPPAADGGPDPESLMAGGCFACLERAFESARERGLDAIAFETAALLTLRTKELGMPSARWMATARDLAAGDKNRHALLEIIAALPADPMSGPADLPDAQARSRFRPDGMLPQWMSVAGASRWSPTFRLYLQLALTCASDRATAAAAAALAAAAPERVRAAPLIQYRLGICNNAQADTLRTMRAASADFVDADYALGRYAMQVRGYADVDEALRRLGSAAAAFPQSPAIATVAGTVHQTIEAWPEALTAYDAALALTPDHPDAMLGRIVSLSHLSRHDEAIAAASRLIDARRWFVGQALYWRAWNHFQLESYVAARADADRARQLLINSGVYLLSGVIDWRLGRLDSAEADFEESLRLDASQCDAATFLGGVRSERARPADALTAFRRAFECYESVIAARRAAAERLLTNTGVPESYRTREVTRHERAIADAVKRRQEAREGIDRLEAYLTSNPSQSRPPRQ